jgi:hypothetical protein
MYTENFGVQLSFMLLNDSDAPTDVNSESWKIVIDGSELKDSGMIFGNGPEPTGGYHILKPGNTMSSENCCRLQSTFREANTGCSGGATDFRALRSWLDSMFPQNDGVN